MLLKKRPYVSGPIFFFIVTCTNDAVYLSLSVPKKNVDIKELRICCLLLLFGFLR